LPAAGMDVGLFGDAVPQQLDTVHGVGAGDGDSQRLRACGNGLAHDFATDGEVHSDAAAADAVGAAAAQGGPDGLFGVVLRQSAHHAVVGLAGNGVVVTRGNNADVMALG